MEQQQQQQQSSRLGSRLGRLYINYKFLTHKQFAAMKVQAQSSPVVARIIASH
jgi:hypothetical protein